MVKKEYEDISSAVTNYARKLENFNQGLGEPENIYSVLKFIVEKFNIPTPRNPYAKNYGIEVIVEQLNKLKGDLVFLEWYEVTYTKKDRPKVEKKY